MKLKYNFAIQHVLDFWAAVPVGSDSRRYEGIIVLNETAKDMMQYLHDDISEEELMQKMLAEYDVDEATLRPEMQDFIAKLRETGVLVE